MTSISSSDLDRLARETLLANDRGGYTVPSAKVYPFQWNWDSAFVAMGFATFDIPRAWLELETLFLGQWSDGMVPSIVFHQPADHYYPGPKVWGTQHNPPTTGISQPPLAATAARCIFETAGGRDVARAKALFPKLLASHRWWHETRDPQRSGMVTIVHPWETGRDNSPEWDAPLANIKPTVDVSSLRKDNKAVDPSERPTDDFYNRVMTLVEEAKALHWDGDAVATRLSFRVCDVGVQSILMRADRDLMWLAGELGLHDEAAQLASWIETSQRGFQRLRHADGTYRSLDLITGLLSPMLTVGSFLPLYARACTINDADLLAGLVKKWDAHLRYSVPSTDPLASEFDAVRYWRGPVWLVMNRLVADGFAAYRQVGLAGRLRHESHQLALAQGLREYFNPLTGEGLGGEDFSWSAAMWLASAGQEGNDGRMTAEPGPARQQQGAEQCRDQQQANP